MNPVGVAQNLQKFVADLSHGDEERRGLFGDNFVDPDPSDGSAGTCEHV
jgi:hypothetical protein